MHLLVKLLTNALAVFTTAYILPGVTVDDYWIAIIAAIILGILNSIVKPILIILTLPATILTLGLWILIMNALLIQLGSELVDGFSVDNFWWALLFSIVLSVINSFLNSFSKEPHKPVHEGEYIE